MDGPDDAVLAQMIEKMRIKDDDDERTQISKKLSYVLRHGANQLGLDIDAGGFVQVSDLLACQPIFGGVSPDSLLSVVEKSNVDKQRYELSEDGGGGWLIRASGKHTMQGLSSKKKKERSSRRGEGGGTADRDRDRRKPRRETEEEFCETFELDRLGRQKLMELPPPTRQMAMYRFAPGPQVPPEDFPKVFVAFCKRFRVKGGRQDGVADTPLARGGGRDKQSKPGKPQSKSSGGGREDSQRAAASDAHDNNDAGSANNDGSGADADPFYPSPGSSPRSLDGAGLHTALAPSLQQAALPPVPPPQQPPSLTGMMQQSLPMEPPRRPGMGLGMPQHQPPQSSQPQQGIPQQGIPHQGIPQQGIPQQGIPQQGIPLGGPYSGLQQQGMFGSGPSGPTALPPQQQQQQQFPLFSQQQQAGQMPPPPEHPSMPLHGGSQQQLGPPPPPMHHSNDQLWAAGFGQRQGFHQGPVALGHNRGYQDQQQYHEPPQGYAGVQVGGQGMIPSRGFSQQMQPYGQQQQPMRQQQPMFRSQPLQPPQQQQQQQQQWGASMGGGFQPQQCGQANHGSRDGFGGPPHAGGYGSGYGSGFDQDQQLTLGGKGFSGGGGSSVGGRGFGTGGAGKNCGYNHGKDGSSGGYHGSSAGKAGGYKGRGKDGSGGGSNDGSSGKGWNYESGWNAGKAGGWKGGTHMSQLFESRRNFIMDNYMNQN